MISIGGKEFKDNEELSVWLEELVETGEQKMKEGMSARGVEDLTDYWCEAVSAAVEKGEVAAWVRDRFWQAICKNMGKPYPDACHDAALKDFKTFGLHGLSTEQ